MLKDAKNTRFPFTPHYRALQAVLRDPDLASLGDAYANFVYSLYLSSKAGKPSGAKVDSSILSKALKRQGLRSLLPSRVDRHKQADAVEALLVYAWLQGLTTITESITTLVNSEDAVGAFSALITEAAKKLSLSFDR